MTRVAIIGAGIGGLTLAREIAARSDVVVFEKSRGCGGRMATRQAQPYEFDHGAQFFTAKSEAFRGFLQPYIDAGQVARWDAEFVEIDAGRIVSRRNWADGPAHYVGVPRMNTLARQMGEDLDVRLQTRVGSLETCSAGWLLRDQQGQDLGLFDWVISAIPAAQADALLPPGFAGGGRLKRKKMLGCYSLMLGFEHPVALDWQAAYVDNADISWISNNSSKPGRPPAYTLLIHSTNRWAEEHIDADGQYVVAHLLEQLQQVAAFDPAGAQHVGLHRWRYANIGRQNDAPCVVDHELKLAAIGDWCIHGRVEAAFTSAMRLVQHLERFD